MAALDHLGEELELGAGGVLGGELDVLELLARHLHALDGALDDLLLRELQLEVAVDGRGGEEDVAAAAGRVLQRLPGGVDVALVAAREARDDRPLDLLADRADGLEVARRGGGEAGLDDVHAEVAQGARHLELLLEVHGGAGATARRRAAWCRR